MPRIVDSILVDDHGPDQSTELDQRVPFPAIARKTCRLNREHGANAAGADRTDQAIKAGPGGTATRSTKIIVNDLYARPPELLCAIGERILATSALVIMHELPWSGLTNVHVGAACKMLSSDLGHRRPPGLRAPLRSRRTGLRATSRAVLFAFPTGRFVEPPVRTEWDVGFRLSDCGAS